MPRSAKERDELIGTPDDTESNVQRTETRMTSAETGSDLIARRAYDRFQERGGEHGRDQEDWFEAERELNGGRG